MDTWTERVTQTLQAIPDIYDIKVTADVSDGSIEWDNGLFPITAHIDFTLHIPTSVQGNLSSSHPQSPCEAEEFRVMIFYDFYGPASFVIPIGSDSVGDSSNSVRIVREFLTEVLAPRDLPARFHFLGPSPFHADVNVRLTRLPQDAEDEIELTRVPSRGYDEFQFACYDGIFESMEEAVSALTEDLVDELSFFYHLVNSRNERNHNTIEIGQLTRNLITSYERTGFRAFIKRVFTPSARMRRVTIKAISTEYDTQTEIATARTNANELYATDIKPYFRDYIEAEMTDQYPGIIPGTKELVGLLDAARARQVEVTSLFLSALAGGLAGALVSLLVH